MKFKEAFYEMLCAYEMRYWMFYSVFIMIGYFAGLVNSFGVFSAFVACAIGGVLAGTRISENNCIQAKKEVN